GEAWPWKKIWSPPSPWSLPRLAARLAGTSAAQARVAAKKADLERREAAKPLSAYREEELSHMRAAFSDPRAPYHALRTAFVHGRTAP
ncbi:hypothetical protein ACWCOY_37210, partial [Streptomyces tubercidicus]